MAYYKVPTTSKVVSMLNRRGRLEKVIDIVSTLPTNPNQGDRYIDLNDNKVKEYDGSTWQEYTPNQGDNLYVLNRDRYYYFNGSEWVDLVSTASLWEQSGDTLTPKTANNIQINGSFIGDGSQLTGIKKLIEEFVAQGNVTAGDVVAFVNGKIKKGKTPPNEVSNQGEEFTFNTGVPKYINAIKLTESKVVLVYHDMNNNYRGMAIIGEINGTQITFGSEYVFSNDAYDISADRLTDSKFVVAYVHTGNVNKGMAIIGEVNGTQITFGSEYAYHNSTSYEISVCSLTDSKFVVVYRNAGGDNHGLAVVGTVSGTTIVYGNEYDFSNEIARQPSISKLTDTKFVIAYWKDEDGDKGTAIIGEVNGTQITFGNNYIFNTKITNSPSVCSLTDSKFVVAYRNVIDNKGMAIIGEVNGTTITYGNEYIFKEGGVYYISTSKLNNTKFVIAYTDYTNNQKGTAIIGEVNGTQITFGSEYIFDHNSTNTIFISVCSLTDSKFVVGYRVYINNDYYGYATICELSTTELDYIGIAQETKNDGEKAKVLIQGISPVHNSLIVGQKYYATKGGDLTDKETSDYLGIAVSPTELLLLDWQRPKTIYDETEDVFYMPT